MGSMTDKIDQMLANPGANPDNGATGTLSYGDQPTAPTPSPTMKNKIDQLLLQAEQHPNAPPIPPPPQVESSFWGNTGTGLARGIGGLMGPAGEAESALGQTPFSNAPPPIPAQEIADRTTNMLGGTYKPQTPAGQAYQDILARTVSSAPLAAIGPGGLWGLGARELQNVTGNIGSYTGEKALPSHPVIGSLVGGLLGSGAVPLAAKAGESALSTGAKMIGTKGAVERAAASQLAENPAYAMPMSEVDNTLAQQGGYWTPGRINAASELNKRQAVNGLLPPTPPSSSFPWREAIPHALGGIGLGLGEHLLGNVLPGGLLGIGSGGLGLAAGEVGGYLAKHLIDSRTATFNAAVDKMLQNPTALWPRVQQMQNISGYGPMGYVAPQIGPQPGLVP